MDQTIFHLINEQWTNPVLDLFMAAISNIGIWQPLIIVVCLYLVIWGGFRGRAFLLCLVICFLAGEQVTRILKTAIDRHRPKQVQAVRMVELQKARPEFMTLFKKPSIRFSDESDQHRSGPSFPSGHMTNNTVIAICCTLFYRRRGWLYWILAFAIGWSRIYLGAHWPSDIVGTLFLAVGETLIMLAILELLWRWLVPKFPPHFYDAHPSLVINPK